MLKTIEPVFPSRTTRPNGSPAWVFSIESGPREASGSGRGRAPAGIKAIEPGSGPRRASLNTSSVKDEFASTSKAELDRFASCFSEEIGESRFRSRSRRTLPRATIIRSRMPERASELVCSRSGSQRPGLLARTRRSAKRHPRVFFNDIGTVRFKNLILPAGQLGEKQNKGRRDTGTPGSRNHERLAAASRPPRRSVYGPRS